jgi:hypothetical protein
MLQLIYQFFEKVSFFLKRLFLLNLFPKKEAFFKKAWTKKVYFVKTFSKSLFC